MAVDKLWGNYGLALPTQILVSEWGCSNMQIYLGWLGLALCKVWSPRTQATESVYLSVPQFKKHS